MHEICCDVFVNILLALTLEVYLADHASNISMVVLLPFWKWAVGGLTRLLLVVSGPTTVMYLLVWLFACFRREDLARLVPGWRSSIPKTGAVSVPVRQSWRAQLKAVRKSGPLAEKVAKRTAENQKSLGH